jgi:predicted  nucleic acid-binding Zn-ribbon protein
MKNKVPDPIVPLKNGTCSSCFYPVLPQEILRIKRNALLHCMSCYRLLYYDATLQEQAK